MLSSQNLASLPNHVARATGKGDLWSRCIAKSSVNLEQRENYVKKGEPVLSVAPVLM